MLERNLKNITLSNSREKELKRSLMSVLLMIMTSLTAIFLLFINEVYSFAFHGDQRKFLIITAGSFLIVVTSLTYISALKSAGRLKKLKEKNKASSL